MILKLRLEFRKKLTHLKLKEKQLGSLTREKEENIINELPKESRKIINQYQ